MSQSELKNDRSDTELDRSDSLTNLQETPTALTRRPAMPVSITKPLEAQATIPPGASGVVATRRPPLWDKANRINTSTSNEQDATETALATRPDMTVSRKIEAESNLSMMDHLMNLFHGKAAVTPVTGDDSADEETSVQSRLESIKNSLGSVHKKIFDVFPVEEVLSAVGSLFSKVVPSPDPFTTLFSIFPFHDPFMGFLSPRPRLFPHFGFGASPMTSFFSPFGGMSTSPISMFSSFGPLSTFAFPSLLSMASAFDTPGPKWKKVEPSINQAYKTEDGGKMNIRKRLLENEEGKKVEEEFRRTELPRGLGVTEQFQRIGVGESGDQADAT